MHVLTAARLAVALVALTVAGSAISQTSAPAGGTARIAEIDLTPEERQERLMRKSCKLALCAAFHVRGPADGEVACAVVKTWRKEQLDRTIGRGGISWPWGNARCTTNLRFQRATLAKAMTEPAYEATFDRHQISCELDRETDKYQVKIEIAPKVQFKHGKAVKASLNWGRIDAPLLARSALWSATAADNTFGVLQGTVVEDINDFIDAKCAEVRDEWAGK